MARAAVANGIGCAILTPHIHPGRYENTRSIIENHWRAFERELRIADIPLRTGIAAEVRLSPEILDLIEKDEIPFLGEVSGYRIMLLEFPHSHIPPGADKLVDKLLQMKIRPMIAHPERNKEVIRNIEKIDPFVEMGCLMQLTASSVAGRFGPGARIRARQLLGYEACVVLATDSHNMNARVPDLYEGYEAAAEVLGAEAAARLVEDNPFRIVQSQLADSKLPEEVVIGKLTSPAFGPKITRIATALPGHSSRPTS
jgi:protein-tyrosine phosphatase